MVKPTSSSAVGYHYCGIQLPYFLEGGNNFCCAQMLVAYTFSVKWPWRKFGEMSSVKNNEAQYKVWIDDLCHLRWNLKIIINKPTMEPLIHLSLLKPFSVVQKSAECCRYDTVFDKLYTPSPLTTFRKLNWQWYSFKSYLYTFVPLRLHTSFLRTFDTILFNTQYLVMQNILHPHTLQSWWQPYYNMNYSVHSH